MRNVAMAMALALLPIATAHAADERVVGYEKSDARMNAAIAEARTYLDKFTAAFESAPAEQAGAFTLKVGLPVEGGGQEHIWVGALERRGAGWQGRLANEPVYLGPTMKRGSIVTFDADQISDWSIDTADGLYGSFTTRVMLRELSEAEAAQIRAMLAPAPVPEAWRD